MRNNQMVTIMILEPKSGVRIQDSGSSDQTIVLNELIQFNNSYGLKINHCILS